jgi:hypothetical protein
VRPVKDDVWCVAAELLAHSDSVDRTLNRVRSRQSERVRSRKCGSGCSLEVIGLHVVEASGHYIEASGRQFAASGST